MSDWQNTPAWRDKWGHTLAGEWWVDRDIGAERVVLSLLQWKGSEARLTLEEADRLAQALSDAAQSVRKYHSHIHYPDRTDQL